MAKIKSIEYFRVKPRWLFVKVTDEEGRFGWGEGTLEGHSLAVEGALDEIITRIVGYEAEYAWIYHFHNSQKANRPWQRYSTYLADSMATWILPGWTGIHVSSFGDRHRFVGFEGSKAGCPGSRAPGRKGAPEGAGLCLDWR